MCTGAAPAARHSQVSLRWRVSLTIRRVLERALQAVQLELTVFSHSKAYHLPIYLHYHHSFNQKREYFDQLHAFSTVLTIYQPVSDLLSQVNS